MIDLPLTQTLRARYNRYYGPLFSSKAGARRVFGRSSGSSIPMWWIMPEVAREPSRRLTFRHASHGSFARAWNHRQRAAREPEINDCRRLPQQMGAKIVGVRTPRIVIRVSPD
jgi:hypothetical protein